MKSFFAFLILLLCLGFASGQNELAPIGEKEIKYKDWTYKNVRTGEDINLREFTKGKKLVIVIYFAPWCHDWKADAPKIERLYEKYKSAGLEFIAVGEYDPVASMKGNIETYKLTFPMVSESENRTERQKTLHYGYRTSTGDSRNWGSPYYIFLDPAHLEKRGDLLTKHTFVINGEMIEAEGEKFIRAQLGLPPINAKASTAKAGEVEVCDPGKPSNPVTNSTVKKP